MATLVTGAGLVGSHVASLLSAAGEQVVLLDINPNKEALRHVVDLDQVRVLRVDLIDLPEIIRAITQHAVEKIIHTASLTSDVWQHPYRGVKVNIEAFANVYEAARITGVKRVTISSSSGVYAAGNPHDPEDPRGPIEETATLRPGTVYGTTKLLGEHLGLNYHHIYGVEFSAVRYPVVIPPRPDTFHYIPSTDISRVGGVIPAMVKAALSGQEASFVEWGSHEWGYVKDIAKGTILANTTERAAGRIYNLGVGKTVALKEVAAIIHELVPMSRIRVVDDPSVRTGHPLETDRRPAYPHDISRARQELGYSPEYDMPKAIKEIIQNAQ